MELYKAVAVRRRRTKVVPRRLYAFVLEIIKGDFLFYSEE